MEQIQKEKEENVGGKKPTDKNMKLYMVLSFVLSLLLTLVIVSQCLGSCDRSEVNDTARYNEIDRRITDVMREKEKIDGMKVEGTFKHGMDSIGIFEKDGKRGFYNLNTNKVLVPATYTHAWFFSEGLAAVEKDGKIGFINMKGALVEIIQDDLIVKVEPLTCNVQLKEKDAEGRWRLQEVEMRMDYYVYYTFAYNNRCGLMDKDGNRLTEPVYSKIEALNEHLFSFYLLDGETQFVKSL